VREEGRGGRGPPNHHAGMVDGEWNAVGVGVETGRGGGGVKREGEREEGEGNERVGVRGGAWLDHTWTV
jgi:hypothetical protein